MMGHLHVLWHEAPVAGESGADAAWVTMLGCFTDLNRAEEEMAFARLLPQFRGSPDGFRVEFYDINNVEWRSGFSPCP